MNFLNEYEDFEDYEDYAEKEATVLPKEKKLNINEKKLNEFKKILFKATKIKSLENLEDEYFEEVFWECELRFILDIIVDFRTKKDETLVEYLKNLESFYNDKNIDYEDTPAKIILEVLNTIQLDS